MMKFTKKFNYAQIKNKNYKVNIVFYKIQRVLKLN